jgi:hypothetical protein
MSRPQHPLIDYNKLKWGEYYDDEPSPDLK